MGEKLKTIVFKYGGNAMTDKKIKSELITEMCKLREQGHRVIVVHGGGPFIRQALEEAGIESEFIAGQRKTSKEALQYVEMALKGRVNGDLVRLFNKMGHSAVGLSGKDGELVLAKKRYHEEVVEGKTIKSDLGQVGDVEAVNAELLELLLDAGFLPVITCLASDSDGNDYNINGDIFAGHIAGAMQADEFVVLTDVDGLLEDVKNPDSLITLLSLNKVPDLVKRGIIKGGMIPKLEACGTALRSGARAARIINGTKPGQLSDLIHNKNIGTLITPS